LDWLKKDDMLAGHEIVRLADIAISHLGIEEIRFTGGEPLVRADLVDILDGIHTRHPQVDLSMTTNGIDLERKIDYLVSPGLTRTLRRPSWPRPHPDQRRAAAPHPPSRRRRTPSCDARRRLSATSH